MQAPAPGSLAVAPVREPYPAVVAGAACDAAAAVAGMDTLRTTRTSELEATETAAKHGSPP